MEFIQSPQQLKRVDIDLVIYNEIFTFYKNQIYKLRSGVYFANTNIHTTYFDSGTISNLGPSLLILMPEKIKNTQTLSVFISKFKP